MPRILYFALFLTIVLVLLVGSHFYFHLRLVRNPAWTDPWRSLGTWTIVLMGGCVPFVFLLSRVLPYPIARVALFVPYVWLGMMVFLFGLLVVADLLKFVS